MRPDLPKMATSNRPEVRLHSLRLMRQEIANGSRPEEFLDLARPLIEDTDNDCRWQALIVVGESIPSNPEAVWQVICKYGASADDDLRGGVATVLLEELLGCHFDAFFPRLKEQVCVGGPLFADTLSSCWPMGQAEHRWNEVRALFGQTS